MKTYRVPKGTNVSFVEYDENKHPLDRRFMDYDTLVEKVLPEAARLPEGDMDGVMCFGPISLRGVIGVWLVDRKDVLEEDV